MKRLFVTILWAPAASTLVAQGSSAHVRIDREVLFENPEITGHKSHRMVNTSRSSSRGKTRETCG
jgi:hypothetical protein